MVRAAGQYVAREEVPSEGVVPKALALASMCLQEGSSIRPVISNVVAVLSFLADPK